MSTLAANRVTVAGSFGLGNVGDEAVAPALKDLAEAQGLAHEFDVLGRFPEIVIPGVIGLGPQDEQRRQALLQQQVLLVGGGVIEPQPTAVVFRCGAILRRTGLDRVSLFAAGAEAGVRYGWLARRRLRRLLMGMHRLYVRDDASARVLRGLAPRRRVEVCGDCVLWLRPALELPAEVRGLGPMVGVCLAPRWNRETAFGEWLAEHLVMIARRLGAAVVFVPCSTRFDDDRQEQRRVAALVRARAAEVPTVCLEQSLTARQVAGILGHCTLTVAMRLHACVMAYAQRRPFVGLIYHPKLAAFAETAGCEAFMIPRCPPLRQSGGVYGYSLRAAGLLGADLTAVAMEALEKSRWGRLDDLRSRLAQALLDSVTSR